MANGLGMYAHQQVAVAARRRCGGGWEWPWHVTKAIVVPVWPKSRADGLRP